MNSELMVVKSQRTKMAQRGANAFPDISFLPDPSVYLSPSREVEVNDDDLYDEDGNPIVPVVLPTLTNAPRSKREVVKENIERLTQNISFLNEHEIRIEEHPFLQQYYELALNLTERNKGGLFILDTKGIYTPIQMDTFGVVHLVRLPRRPQDVYAITDFRNCIQYAPNDDRRFIFQGVEMTVKYGYRFMGDEFHISPVSGVAPVLSAIMDFVYEAPKDDAVEEHGDELSGELFKEEN